LTSQQTDQARVNQSVNRLVIKLAMSNWRTSHKRHQLLPKIQQRPGNWRVEQPCAMNTIIIILAHHHHHHQAVCTER